MKTPVNAALSPRGSRWRRDRDYDGGGGECDGSGGGGRSGCGSSRHAPALRPAIIQ
jgi:hypothetical protein